MKISGYITRDILHGVAVAAALCSVTGVSAQLHENVTVEGHYVPEIIRADRINVFPSAFTPRFDGGRMEYELNGVPASFRPAVVAMPATGWRSIRSIDTHRGYVDFQAGSWLNTSLSAGYRIVDTSSTLFGVTLQHNSTSLWKPKLSEGASDVKRESCDESVGLYASHVFSGAGRLDASLRYHVGCFNYYGYHAPLYPQDVEVNAPTQTLNDIDFRAGWRSLLTAVPSVSYYTNVGVRYFGYRSLYLPRVSMERIKGLRETDFSVEAGVRAPWADGSSAGVDVRFDYLGYSGGKEVVFAGQSLPGIDDYGMLTLTPSYDFTKGLLQIHVGADIDLAFNAGPEGSRYSLFHIAPDVRFALRRGGFGMSLDLLGGSELQTLASQWQLDYYQMPRLATTRPVYTPLDARLGIEAGPFAGFAAGVSVAWKSTRRVSQLGWYTVMLDYGTRVAPGVGIGSGEVPRYSLDADGLSISGVSLGAHLDYDPGKYVRLHGDVNYQPQDGKRGYFNGYDRPRWILRAEGVLTPVKPLSVTLSYEYRGVRNIYGNTLPARPGAGGNVSVDGSSLSPSLMSMRLPDLTLLGLSASWSFTDSFSVSLRGDNLLNRHDALLPSLPSEGVSITAGLQWLF